MKVAIHQPDLLPWPGFWFKMINVDKFVIAVHDQLQKHWVQRRVTMRDTWVTLPLVGKPRLIPINDRRGQGRMAGPLGRSIRGRYTGARHWATRGDDVIDRIRAVDGHNLADDQHPADRDGARLLGITTEVVTTPPPTRRGRSGARAAADGGCHLLRLRHRRQGLHRRRSRTAVRGARHRPGVLHHHKTTGDSVVTLLMDYDDPMEIIALGE